jgi:hypothetical protein
MPPNDLSPSLRTERIDHRPLFSEGHTWLIGWFVIQGMGWLIIFKDLYREVRGVKWAPVPVKAFHSDQATLQSIEPPAVQPMNLANNHNHGSPIVLEEAGEPAPVTEP